MEKQAYYFSEFGNFKIKYINKIITFLKITDEINGENIYSEVSDLAFKQVQEYLHGKRKKFNFLFKFLHGTEFQKKVWSVLEFIPYGETRTYKEIAVKIGNVNASRAVGLALNKNPIWFAVPCHRVISSNGKFTGYAGGIELKKTLIDLERENNF